MTETLKIMRAWDRGRNKIAYVYRDSETGKTKIGETKFQNWFYLKQKDFQEHRSLLYRFKEENTITGFEDVGKYVKVFIDTVHNDELMNKDMEWVWEYKNFKTNKMLEQLKMIGVQTYEADVKAYKRWLLQESVEIEREYKIMYYDIETDDRHADGLTPGKYRILSVAVKLSDNHNTDGKMYWLCTEEDTDEAEKAMLEKLAKLINANDVIISFNGMNFDDPYIKSRFVRYGIQIDWRKKFLQDHCWAYKKYAPALMSYSLDNISKSVLKRGKVDHTGMRIWDMWESNRKLLKEYNIEDVQLMFEIECKTGFLSAHRDICAEGRCTVDDLYVSRKIDNFILKQAEEDNEFHFKTVEFKEDTGEDEDDISFEGAFVFPPVAGRHKDIKVVDFASLYPNVINTFNISPDTIIEKEDNLPASMIITNPTKHRYRKDFIGILPKVVMKLKTKRDYWNGLKAKETPGTLMHKVYDRMQYLYKYFGLSFYGCMGEKHGRTYDVRVAESVTLTGQYFTKECAKYIEKNGLKVAYGDSITKERNTVLMIDGEIYIKSFEELYEMTDERSMDGEKEIGYFYNSVFVLSYNFKIRQSEWKPIRCVIRHKTDKKVYLFRYREGITKVTEDHSLIDQDGNIFKPTEHFNAFSIPSIRGDRIKESFSLHKYIPEYDYENNGRKNGIVFYEEHIQLKKHNKCRFLTSVNKDNIYALLKICAHYICNGSASTFDTSSRFMFSIANRNIKLLEELKADLQRFFPDSKIVIRENDKEGNWKVVIANAIAAIIFKQLCGQKYNAKKIPNFVYNLEEKYQQFFILEMMKGDGTIQYLNGGKSVYDFECASVNVVSGLAYLLRLNHHEITCQTNKDRETFTIKSRHGERYGKHLVKNVLKQIPYDDYVYDLSVEDNNNFVDAMGNLLLHNTDSVFIFGLTGHETVKKLSRKLTDLCDAHAKRKFNCDICTIKMEYDKSFKTFVVMDAKKRYAGVIDYLDGHEIKDFNMYVAGLEYKRTDVCQILKDKQYAMLKLILENEETIPVDEARKFILELKEQTFSGKLTIDDIRMAQKLTKGVETYGNQIHAKVAKEMIADGKEVWVGDKIPYFIIGVDADKKPIPKPAYKFEGRYCESYYWNNKIFPALQRILDVVYPSIDWESYKAVGKGEVKTGRTNLW